MGILYKDSEERSLRLKAIAFTTAGLILIFFEEYTEGFVSGHFSHFEQAGNCRTGSGALSECKAAPIMSIKMMSPKM